MFDPSNFSKFWN